MLPVKIREIAPQQRSSNTRKEFALQEKEVLLHWLSVNVEFEDSSFSDETILQYEKAMKFVTEGKRELMNSTNKKGTSSGKSVEKQSK